MQVIRTHGCTPSQLPILAESTYLRGLVYASLSQCRS